MNPFFFGTRQRRLFGLYTPGVGSGGRARAAVLCHPWGQEYLRAHRTMKRLSSMLTAKGIHVLCFDYFGTGDSGGEMEEARLAGWEADIGTAIEELRDSTDAARITLVGLRLGATLAARVAARSPKEVDALVLWDPVVSGGEYLDELLQRSGKTRKRTEESGGGYEVLGFPLTAAMIAEFESIDLLPVVPSLPARTLVVVSDERESHSRLKAVLAERADGQLPMESIVSQPPWLKARDREDGAVPVQVLQRICQWLG